ncbi:MAG: 2OG-Fe(II) oxygenase [Phaeodactylibacter sp.]|uniref:2OG-Fe(II) oxygenase n=1 Tax=Phaeodactylibacter sp. TaxID=1940289 RepID=UPI0032EFF0D7
MTKVTLLLQEAIYEQAALEIAEQGYSIIDGFLSAAEVDSILQAIHAEEANGSFSPAGIGQGAGFQRNRNIRRDYIRWVNHAEPPVSCIPYFERLQALIRYLNRTCYLGIRDLEMHFAVYQPGGFYKRHLDVFQHAQSRKLSAICYLNPNWVTADGGALKLYLPREDGTENTITVLPEAGRLILFESHAIEHEVEVAHRERCSITGWLKDEVQFF